MHTVKPSIIHVINKKKNGETKFDNFDYMLWGCCLFCPLLYPSYVLLEFLLFLLKTTIHVITSNNNATTANAIIDRM